MSINIQTVTEQVSIISVNDKQAVNQYSNSYRKLYNYNIICSVTF